MALSQVCDEVSCNMIIVEGFFPSFFSFLLCWWEILGLHSFLLDDLFG